MTIRITGLNSGLDTDSIIKELVSAYSVKKDNYVKAQTKLSWKQSAWKSLNTKIYSLYENISNLRFTAAYTLKTASVSDSTKATVTAGNSAVNGSYSLSISKIAKSGYLTGGKLASSTTENSTLSDLGYTGGTGAISVTSQGKTTSISVDGTTTISDFVTKLNNAGVKASYDSTNQRIYVAASSTGVDNDFSLTGTTSDGVNALTKLGLNVASTSNSAAYSSWAAYAKDSDGNSYYVLDSNGNLTYDTDGNVITSGGTYSETKTQEAIQTYLDQVTSATDSNTTLKAASEAASTKITANVKQIAYANAYKSTQDAISSLSSSEQKDILTLGAMSSSNLAKSYKTDEDGNLLYDSDGKLIEATESDTYSVKGSDRLTALETSAGLITTTGTGDEATTDSSAATAFLANLSTVNKYEADEDNASNVTDVKEQYAAGTISDLTSSLETEITSLQDTISANNTQITANNAVISQYALISDGETSSALASRVSYAQSVIDNPDSVTYSSGATRVNGQDSVISLNGAEYTSSTNSYSINGLTIEALAVTGDSEVTITSKTDTDGIYNKIKSFLTEYNSLINEMTSLYNADSAKGYEPLTSDEKDSMTDTEVEEWEEKIKSALLRRDDTLDGVMSAMENSMAKSYTINGKTYSLSSFGISTLGILNASDNQQNAYHINGDTDDSATSTKTDKLRAAIENNPDDLVEYMKQLTSGLYDALDSKMKATTLSSVYTVYNDKEMAKEYSDYTTTISDWEDKVSDMEDYYYKKFAAMESALATLQSNASSLSSLLG